jgi:hypothetical protein
MSPSIDHVTSVAAPLARRVSAPVMTAVSLPLR